MSSFSFVCLWLVLVLSVAQDISIRQITNFYVAQNVSFLSLYFTSIATEKNHLAIPKFLFRTAPRNLDALHPKFHEILANTSIENPSYNLIYFSHSDQDAFVKSHYPSYYDGYSSLIPGAFRADIFRLLVLYSFGGIYNDISHKYLEKISEVVLEGDEFVSVKEINNWGIQQGFIAAYPKHPLILKMIKVVMDMVHRQDYSDASIDITGPYAVFRAFNLFFDRKPYLLIKAGAYSIKGYKVRFYYNLHGVYQHFITRKYDPAWPPVIESKFKALIAEIIDTTTAWTFQGLISWQGPDIEDESDDEIP